MTVSAFASLVELAAVLNDRSETAESLARLYLARIAAANEGLHAFVSVDADKALALARAADGRRAAGAVLGPLDGLPFAIKDLADVEGEIVTAGSQTWRSRRATVTSTAVRRLLAAGMVPLGRTHMVEFAFGGWGTNPVMGTPRNPWDAVVHRIPGGSSSGSGVAVAAGLAPFAIGSDTGGSIRVPAALNGVTGLKTTRGLISLHGTVALSTTLDTLGPLTRTMEDAALVTAVMAGPDPADRSTLGLPAFQWQRPIDDDLPLAGVRIAVMAPSSYPMAVDDAVAVAVTGAGATLARLGARLIEASPPFDFHDLMVRNGRIIAGEAYALHRDWIDDLALPIGAGVRARVQSGRSLSAADYLDALASHRRATADWTAWMRDIDALLLPSLPFPATPVAEVDEQLTPLAAFARAGNFFGACGASLPAGFSAAGLPVAAQLLAKPFDEAALIRIGMAFQAVTDWHRRPPDLTAWDLR